MFLESWHLETHLLKGIDDQARQVRSSTRGDHYRLSGVCVCVCVWWGSKQCLILRATMNTRPGATLRGRGRGLLCWGARPSPRQSPRPNKDRSPRHTICEIKFWGLIIPVVLETNQIKTKQNKTKQNKTYALPKIAIHSFLVGQE